MLGAEETVHGARMRRFVEAFVRDADGERRQVLYADALREHRDEQAGVEAAAQQRADGHVADRVQAQGFVDFLRARRGGGLHLC